MKLFVLLAALIAALQRDHWAFAENCQPEMIETMPEGMRSATFETDLRATHKVLIEMAKEAKSSIKIASMYVSFTDAQRAEHPSAAPGKQMMQALLEAAKRGVKLEIVIDNSKGPMSNLDDVRALEEVATVYRLNMTKLFKAGIMHSKFMITDEDRLYVGSSNFDWRSYSHVKEIGVHFNGCRTMAMDLDKIFQTYKLMSEVDSMPTSLPDSLSTSINKRTPFQLDAQYSMYFAGSPPTVFQKASTGRTDDLEALISVIDKAKKYVKVSVMNYNARTAYSFPKHYWPAIDNALKRAVLERRVRVSLLFSDWGGTREEEYIWYKSLNAIQQNQPRDPKEKYPPPLGRDGGIFVKIFKIPAFDKFQADIPFARVKHDKYVITENALYVSTSNWTPEYFENTCGVSLVFKSNKPVAVGPSIIDDMNKVFDRDYNSAQFARDL